MNVFVLNTGRCGSTTFSRACGHIRNYTSGHETRADLVGPDRLAYPPHHIEVDNRLSWFLGRLHRRFGDEAFYVHLTRDRDATAESFLRRFGRGIMQAYSQHVLMSPSCGADALDVARDYCDTVDANIRLFLRDKTRVVRFRLESAADDFPGFWRAIGAEGDLDAALAEFDTFYNASRVYRGRLRRLFGS